MNEMWLNDQSLGGRAVEGQGLYHTNQHLASKMNVIETQSIGGHSPTNAGNFPEKVHTHM